MCKFYTSKIKIILQKLPFAEEISSQNKVNVKQNKWSKSRFVNQWTAGR
jgi:hypothetical protein